MHHSVSAINARIKYLESLDNLHPRQSTHTHTHSLFIIYIYHNWNVSRDNIPFYASEAILSVLLNICQAATLGGNSQRWTDLDRCHFSWHQLRSDPKTHILYPSDRSRFPPKSHRMASEGCIPEYQ